MAAELRKAVEDGIAAVDGDAPEVACREALERIAAGIKHARGGVIGDDAGDASLADGSDHRDDDGTGAAPAAAVAEAGASVDAAVAVEAVAVEAVAMASPVDAVADGAAVSVTDAVVVDAVVTLDGESLSSSPPWLERVRLFQEHQEQVEQVLKRVKGKTVVLLHGHTSSGKSTLALRLKTDLEPAEFVEDVVEPTNEMTEVGEREEFEYELVPGSYSRGTIAIGSPHPDGTTIVPHLIEVEDQYGGKLAVLDMPSVKDQEERRQFVIEVVYRLVMQQLYGCVLASLVPARSIFDPAFTNGWRDHALSSLHQIFGSELTSFCARMKAVTFVVNHFDQFSEQRRQRFHLPRGLSYDNRAKVLQEKAIDMLARACNAPADCLALFQQLAERFMLMDYAEDAGDHTARRFCRMIQPMLEQQAVSLGEVDTFSMVGAEEAHNCRRVLQHLVAAQRQVRAAVEAASVRTERLVTLLADMVRSKEAAIVYRDAALVNIDTQRFPDLFRRVGTSSLPLTKNIEQISAMRAKLEEIATTARFLKLGTAKKTAQTRIHVQQSVDKNAVLAPTHEIEALVEVDDAIHNGYLVYTGHCPELEAKLHDLALSPEDVVSMVEAHWDEETGGSRILANTVVINDTPDDEALEVKQVRRDLRANRPDWFQLSFTYSEPITLVAVYQLRCDSDTAGYFEDLLEEPEKEYGKMMDSFRGIARQLEGLQQERVKLSAERVAIIEDTQKQIDSMRRVATRTHDECIALLGHVNQVLDNFEEMFMEGDVYGLCGRYLRIMHDYGGRPHAGAGEGDGDDLDSLVNANTNDSSGDSSKPSKEELLTALDFTEDEFDGIDIGALPVTEDEQASYDHVPLSTLRSQFAKVEAQYKAKAAASIAQLSTPFVMPQDPPVLPDIFQQVEGVTEDWEEQKKRILDVA